MSVHLKSAYGYGIVIRKSRETCEYLAGIFRVKGIFGYISVESRRAARADVYGKTAGLNNVFASSRESVACGKLAGNVAAHAGAGIAQRSVTEAADKVAGVVEQGLYGR